MSRLLEADEVLGVRPGIAEHHVDEGVLDVVHGAVMEAGQRVCWGPAGLAPPCY